MGSWFRGRGRVVGFGGCDCADYFLLSTAVGFSPNEQFASMQVPVDFSVAHYEEQNEATNHKGIFRYFMSFALNQLILSPWWWEQP